MKDVSADATEVLCGESKELVGQCSTQSESVGWLRRRNEENPSPIGDSVKRRREYETEMGTGTLN